MIKKSVHEDDLIAGMQRELAAHDKAQGINDLVKAADYLNAALEILDESGLTKQADKILTILAKIASEGQKVPEDLEFTSLLHPKSEHTSKNLEFTSLLHPHKSKSPKDLEFTSLLSEPKDEFSFESMLADDNDAKGKPNKPKNPTTVSDKHTKGLTSEKMIANLKHHGTEFNMSDDGQADDLLNLEINDQNMEVTEGSSYQKDFEDES